MAQLSMDDFRGLSRKETIELLRARIDELGLAERFDLLHALGIYHDLESASGAGSSLRETAALRRALPDLLARLDARSLLDIPCGDHHWMSQVALPGVRYVGADIVPGIVEENRRRFGREREFVVLDLTGDPLPAVDLILCRDLFIHLSDRDVARALANILASPACWLLTTHFTDRHENREITSGDFRPINLCRPPFSLPDPAEVLLEESDLAAGQFRDRAMALWHLPDLRRSRVGERFTIRVERASTPG